LARDWNSLRSQGVIVNAIANCCSPKCGPDNLEIFDVFDLAKRALVLEKPGGILKTRACANPADLQSFALAVENFHRTCNLERELVDFV